MKGTHLVAAGLMVATLTACGSSDTSSGTSGSSGSDGGSGSQFCDAARTAKGAVDVQQALFNLDVAPAPDKVQPAIEDFAAKFAAMTKAAPSEIKSDVETINNAAQQLLAVVKANGFDVVTIVDKPEFTALSDTFSSPEYAAAQGRFEDYTQNICGITTTSES